LPSKKFYTLLKKEAVPDRDGLFSFESVAKSQFPPDSPWAILAQPDPGWERLFPESRETAVQPLAEFVGLAGITLGKSEDFFIRADDGILRLSNGIEIL
jgi:hypothetical protein